MLFIACSLMSGLAKVHLSYTQPISLQLHLIWPLCRCVHSAQQTKKEEQLGDKL